MAMFSLAFSSGAGTKSGMSYKNHWVSPSPCTELNYPGPNGRNLLSLHPVFVGELGCDDFRPFSGITYSTFAGNLIFLAYI